MRVALVGDSQAEGLKVGGLADALARHGHELVHLDDRRGWSTCRMLDADLFAHALASRPDVVLVSSGHNDDGPQVEACFRRAIAQLAAAPRVGWVFASESTRPDVEARHQRNRELLLRIMPASWAVFDGQRYVTRADLAPDGVHLTRAGYRKLAQAVAAGLADAFRPSVWPRVLGLVGGVALGFAGVWLGRQLA